MAGPPNAKKIKFETEKKLFEEVADDFECFYCKIVPREPPIYHLASNGKIVCSTCKESNPKGKFRRDAATTALEKVLLRLPRSCKFKKNDCDVVLDKDVIAYHEEDCQHRDVKCPIGVCANNRNILYPFSELKNHLIEHHKYDMTVPNKNIKECGDSKFSFHFVFEEIHFNKAKGIASWSCGPFMFEGCSFMFHYSLDSDNSYWAFSTMIYGSRFEAKNFHYWIKVEDAEIGTFYYKGPVKSIDDDKNEFMRSHECLTVPAKLLKKYMGKLYRIEVGMENLKPKDDNKDEPNFSDDEKEKEATELKPSI